MVLRRRVAVIVAVFSLFLFVFTAIVILKFDATYRKILNERVTLVEGSETHKLWKDVALGFRTAVKFYFFNITNPDELLHGAPAQLIQLGPYTYRTKWVRVNDTFNGNGTVTFRQKIYYVFDEEESEGAEDDVITTINVPLVAFADQLKGKSVVARGLARIPIKKYRVQLLVRQTVGELTFQGYPDVLVTLGEIAETKDLTFRSGIRSAMDILNKKTSLKTFAFMGDKNGSLSETMTMFTGEGDISKINNIQLLNGKTHVPVWSGEPCNRVRGSFGQVRPPFSTTNKETVFIPDILRSLTLTYAGNSIVGRIKTRRFVLDQRAFSSSAPENACYSGNRTSLPSGLVDLGPLRKGAPVVMSLPHFLNADPSLQKGVQGLEPNEEQHMLYLDSEPVTGVTLTARARIQLNVLLERISGFQPFVNVRSQVVPIFWHETCADARESTLRNIRLATRLPRYIKTLAIVLFALSGIASTTAVAILIRSYRRSTRKEITVLLKSSVLPLADIKTSIV